MNLFYKTLTSISLTLISEHAGHSALINGQSNKTQRFILWQINHMPDYLRYPFFMLTVCFGIQTSLVHLKPFHLLPLLARTRIISTWRNSSLSAQRDFVRLYEALVIFDTSFSEFDCEA
jgi:hypothetical protein